MEYNKLVRDRIPEMIKQSGEIPITHIADDKEYWQKLREKLLEEVDEFLDKEGEEELIDILEVLVAICKFQGIDADKLESLRQNKAAIRGGFGTRIILDETN